MSAVLVRRVTCGVLTVAGAVLIWVPQSEAADGATAAGTSAEAWYMTADACTGSVDCSLVTPPSAYPEDTLHVALTGGAPTASTYLQLDGSALPEDAEITGGTLKLPVDTTPSDGSLVPENAKLVACIVEDHIESKEGAVTEPPKADCKRASSPAIFHAKPAPVFTVDLGAFATHWTDGEPARLAILPAPEAQEAKDTWHVTFWGKKNASKDAAPITADLQHASGTGELPPPAGSQVDSGSPVDNGVSPGPSLGAPQGAPPPAELDAPKAADPPRNDAAPKAAPAAATPELKTYSYPYPIAWAMPLALLIGIITVGRTLTKKISPLP